MYVSAEVLERRSLLSVSEALQLMLMFGSLLISLLMLVVAITKNDKKNNRLALASNGYFLTQ